MKPEASKAGGPSKCSPGGVPLFGRFGRIELVVLTRAPHVVIGVRVSKSVGAPQHALNGLFRWPVQRDWPLARFVLATRDVQHALASRALDVPHLFEIDVAPAYMLYLHA